MKLYLLSGLLLVPAAVSAQAIPPGNWDVTSTAVELDIPGTPSFLLRMMKGRSKVEHKCIAPEQAKAGIAALLQPDPKSKCRVERFHAESGRFDQMLACPQKDGGQLHVARAGTYTPTAFAGRLTMTGQSQKGAVRIVADQTAAHTATTCRK